MDMSRGTELRSQLDHFEKWLGIVKFPSNLSSEEEEEEAPGPQAAKRRREDAEFRVTFAIADDLPTLRALAADPERRWVARRVDLVVVPPQQLAYALVGWTGNRHFNRDLRLYAQRELGLKLSSHGLFDPKTVRRSSGISTFDSEEKAHGERARMNLENDFRWLSPDTKGSLGNRRCWISVASNKTEKMADIYDSNFTAEH